MVDGSPLPPEGVSADVVMDGEGLVSGCDGGERLCCCGDDFLVMVGGGLASDGDDQWRNGCCDDAFGGLALGDVDEGWVVVEQHGWVCVVAELARGGLGGGRGGSGCS